MARQNDHIRAEELISAYLDKRISAEEKDFFERHIASCVDCRAQLETTRSMVAALKALPAMKAPRSFVLPREMVKQPRRSFLPLYPALRLATVIAALGFVVLFAGDLLINQSVGSHALQSIPAAAPAPVVVQAPAAPRAEVQPQAPVAPTQAPAAPTSAPTATEPTNTDMIPAPAGSAAPMVGVSAQAALSGTGAITEAATLSMTTATPEATATADMNRLPKAFVPATSEPTESAFAQAATPAAQQTTVAKAAAPAPTGPALDQQTASAAEQATATNVAASVPAIEPLHVVEIVLLGLAVALGIATLIVRRKQA